MAENQLRYRCRHAYAKQAGISRGILHMPGHTQCAPTFVGLLRLNRPTKKTPWFQRARWAGKSPPFIKINGGV